MTNKRIKILKLTYNIAKSLFETKYVCKTRLSFSESLDLLSKKEMKDNIPSDDIDLNFLSLFSEVGKISLDAMEPHLLNENFWDRFHENIEEKGHRSIWNQNCHSSQ